MPEQKTLEEFMVGSSDAMRKLRQTVLQIAPLPVPVMLHGETGVGKKLVARALHHYSARRKSPFVDVHCASLSSASAEAEIFGSANCEGRREQPGMIEAARGGTLLLDEIPLLSAQTQARLSHFVDSGEVRRLGAIKPRHVDVRLVCTARQDLHELCLQENFRWDLFYRLEVAAVYIPPLRERPEDLPELCDVILRQACVRHQRPAPGLSDAARQKLAAYHWPGNVREMESVLERALVASLKNAPIEADALQLELPAPGRGRRTEEYLPRTHAPGGSSLAQENIEAGLSLEEYFQRFVLEHQDSMSETELAQKLGISRKCLWERRQRFGIPRRNNAAQRLR